MTLLASCRLTTSLRSLIHTQSFVVACGERKIWSKEFAKRDLTTVKAQQRWLRDLLHELGMPSRMSLQAAKEIGEKRALDKEARELGLSSFGVKAAQEEVDADVDEPRRARRAAAQRKPMQQQDIDFGSDDESQSDEEDSGTAEESDDHEGEKPAAVSQDRSVRLFCGEAS